MGETIPASSLRELIALVSGSDSVELKLTVPDGHQRPTGDALELDPLDAEIRQVVFFDTPDLGLNRAGLVVRARRLQGGGGDTVIKLRPVVPEQIPDDLRRSGAVSVEVDAMPGGFVCSASMKGKTTAIAVRQVIGGVGRVGSLFSKRQKAFFEMHAPDEIRMRDLAVLGPINTLKLKFRPKGLEHKMVAEMWLYPDGSRIMELSTKLPPGEALAVASDVRGYLTERGIDVLGDQRTKTKTALEYFASSLENHRKTTEASQLT